MQETRDLRKRLAAAIDAIEVVDTHEFIPNEEDFNMLMDVYQIDRYLSDITWEMKQNSRKNAIIPIRGILKVLGKSFLNN